MFTFKILLGSAKTSQMVGALQVLYLRFNLLILLVLLKTCCRQTVQLLEKMRLYLNCL